MPSDFVFSGELPRSKHSLASLGGKIKMSNRFLVRRASLFLLAAFAAVSAAFADNPGRLIVANRQRVEAMASIAQSDGWVTAAERGVIMDAAKATYSESEIAGLKASLTVPSHLLAARQQAHAASEARLASAMVQPAGKPSQVFSFVSFSEFIEPAKIMPVSLSNNETVLESGAAAPEACWASETCGSCQQGWCGNCWDNIDLFIGVDGFKGPMDLDNSNGNFGLRYGVNGAFPLLELKNIGIQAGTAGVASDFHGTEFTGSSARVQNFTTIGFFQRYPNLAPRLSWGVAFDWLTDDYYANIKLGQWRLKFAYDLSCASEVGLWVCIPDHGDDVNIGSEQSGYSVNNFRPITQCSAYYRRFFETGATAAFWIAAPTTRAALLSVPTAQRQSRNALRSMAGSNVYCPTAAA